MDFSQHHSPPVPFQPMSIHLRDKSYLHQVLPSHDIHSPLSISIPSNQLERTRIPKTITHPQLSSSAFKAWDSGQRHVHRQTSHPGHSVRRQVYGSRRQYSIETLPEFISQPTGYGGQPLYQPHPKLKAYQTNSKTEVTVWGNRNERNNQQCWLLMDCMHKDPNFSANPLLFIWFLLCPTFSGVIFGFGVTDEVSVQTRRQEWCPRPH